MKELVCKMCNSNAIVKKDDLYVCESCGTKYTTEEAEKLSVEIVVKSDYKERISTLLRVAERDRELRRWKDAEMHYEEIHSLDPDNWEAVFYSGVCFAMYCSVANISNAILKINDSLELTYLLIKKSVPDSKKFDIVSDVAKMVYSVAEMLAEAANKFYMDCESEIRNRFYSETLQRYKNCFALAINAGLLVEYTFGAELSHITTTTLKKSVELGDRYKINCCSDSVLTVMGKYDSEFVKAREAKAKKDETKNSIATITVALILLAISVILIILGNVIIGNVMIIGELLGGICKWIGIILGGITIFVLVLSWITSK